VGGWLVCLFVCDRVCGELKVGRVCVCAGGCAGARSAAYLFYLCMPFSSILRQ